MNLEATQSMFFCGFDFVGLAGTSVPAWPRLRGTPKGIGGIATKSKTKGGWRHAPCLPDQNPAPNHKLKKTQKKHIKETKCKKIPNKTQKKYNTKPTS